jgi:hypothetical protein
MPRRGIRSGEGTAMSSDGTEFEYPDQAGYPDGMGTLHEGTEDPADPADPADPEDPVEAELEHFAMEDEEDDDEGV